MNSNKKNSTLTNIINNINNKNKNNNNNINFKNINAVSVINDSKSSSTDIEDCKKIMSDYKIMPMFSVKNIIAGSIMPPLFAWIALLIIIIFIILI